MINSLTKQFCMTVLSVLLFCSIANSATYDFLEKEEQPKALQFQNIFPQQQEAENQKKEYLTTLAMIRNNKLIEAENKITKLIQNNPKEPEFYNLKALLEVFKKKPKLAIKHYQKAIELDPKNYDAHLATTKLLIDIVK